MYNSLYIVLFFVFFEGYAQQEIEHIENHQPTRSHNEIFEKTSNQETHPETIKVVDPFYREDQLYIAITYNLLQNKPVGISQNTLSSGLHFGFLRDMPINKARSYSIAVGLGFSINSLKQNLKISEINGEVIYEKTPTDIEINKNKLDLNYLEFPIELRWRTSTYDSHKFWRLYTGFKLSYLVSDHSKFVAGDIRETVKDNKDLNKFHYGLYTAFGYNTWNFQVYYGLNPLFRSGTINSQAINFRTINMGLMFYIL